MEQFSNVGNFANILNGGGYTNQTTPIYSAPSLLGGLVLFASQPRSQTIRTEPWAGSKAYLEDVYKQYNAIQANANAGISNQTNAVVASQNPALPKKKKKKPAEIYKAQAEVLQRRADNETNFDRWCEIMRELTALDIAEGNRLQKLLRRRIDSQTK